MGTVVWVRNLNIVIVALRSRVLSHLHVIEVQGNQPSLWSLKGPSAGFVSARVIWVVGRLDQLGIFSKGHNTAVLSTAAGAIGTQFIG